MGDGGDQPRPTDAQLIERSWSDPHAFATLFERHAASVHRYLLRRVGPESAEDLVGETFVAALRSRSNYDLSRCDARPWLFGIATNLARHFWRSEARHRSWALPGPEESLAYDHGDEASQRAFFSSLGGVIAEALSQLDDGHLDVLLLIAGPGFSYEEVAEALDIPIGTVRSRMSRTRARLRELLGEPRQYLDGDRAHGASTAVTKDDQ